MGGKGSGRGGNRLPPTSKRPNRQARELTGERIWERQPKETDKAWDAFLRYRDLPERSLRLTAEALGRKSQAVIEEWSRQWSWVKRVNAWDRHVDIERNATLIETKKDIVRRRVEAEEKAIDGLFRIATVELSRHINALEAGGHNPNTKRRPSTDISGLRGLMADALKLGRLVRGEAESTTKIQHETWADRVNKALDE